MKIIASLSTQNHNSIIFTSLKAPQKNNQLAVKTTLLNNLEIRVSNIEHGEYLCVTDLAKAIGGNTGKIMGNLLVPFT